MMRRNWIGLLMLVLLGHGAMGQSVEAYAGHRRAGVDLMWFRYFQRPDGGSTPWLFFSRNRASADYHDSPTAFGSTNAVSYNFRSGVGLVASASYLQEGLVPKAGVQYYRQRRALLFFGWLVADLQAEGSIDLFCLLRFQPAWKGDWKGFGQLELFPTYRPASEWWHLAQRLRLGAQYRHWGAGLMADFSQSGRRHWQHASNLGLFLRHQF